MKKLSKVLILEYKLSWILAHLFLYTRWSKYFIRLKNDSYKRIVDKIEARDGQMSIQELDPKDSVQINKFLRNRIPFVLRNFTPDCDDWDFEKLKSNYGEVIQPTYSNEVGVSAYRNLNVRKIVDEIQRGNKDVNVLFGNIIFSTPELKERFSRKFHKVFSSYKLGLMKIDHFFLSAKDTDTYFHAEFGDNMFFQLQGSKEWYLFHPKHSFIFNPRVQGKFYFNSDFDCHTIASDKPLTCLPHYKIILNKGDVLYNPALYWHYVKTLQDSVSVSSRWSRLSSLLRYPLMSFFICSATDPSVIKQFLNKSKTHPDNLY